MCTAPVFMMMNVRGHSIVPADETPYSYYSVKRLC
jgi:hypothetical protein